MAVGHGEVAVVGLDIEGQGAQLLDGIDAEQHAMLAAAATKARQIQAQAAGELHGADRQQACSRGEGGEQRCFRIFALEADLDHLHTLGGQRQPDDAVGREFLVANDHLIAGSPVQAECHEGQCLGGIFDQRNITGAWCVHQTHKAFA